MTPQVFVSRPAALSTEQSSTYRRWLSLLGALGFAASTVDRAAYESTPWEQLRRTIGAADGAIILGFRQLWVDEGAWRSRTPEATIARKWWATPWNQVEAGLALMALLPVLAVPEEGVAEGVFSADVWGGDLFGVGPETELHPVEADGRSLADEGIADPLPQPVAAWARAVRRRARELAGSTK